jgi:hypothetical protein
MFMDSTDNIEGLLITCLIVVFVFMVGGMLVWGGIVSFFVALVPSIRSRVGIYLTLYLRRNISNAATVKQLWT